MYLHQLKINKRLYLVLGVIDTKVSFKVIYQKMFICVKQRPIKTSLMSSSDSDLVFETKYCQNCSVSREWRGEYSRIVKNMASFLEKKKIILDISFVNVDFVCDDIYCFLIP